MTEIIAAPRTRFYRLNKVRKSLQTPWTLSVLLVLLVALIDSANLGNVIGTALAALAGTAPFIVIAVLLIGWLKATGAEAMVGRAFQGRESVMILMAAVFGGLAPFCSCEVIPFIAGLLAVGAPLSAVMAFWLSSPLIDPPTLFITAAALGWPFAVGKAVAAVGLGLFGGFVMKMLLAGSAFASPLKAAQIGCCGCGPSTFDGRPVWRFWTAPTRRQTFVKESAGNGLFLLKWLSLAYVLEALLISYVPAEAVAAVVGGEGVMAIATAAVVGMPAYLNGYAAPPLLAGLMTQGMSGGAAMAFMVAGEVSSIPAMAAVYSLVKAPVFASYIALGLGGAVVSGILFQFLI